VRLGRNDLSNIRPPGKESYEDLSACIHEARAASPYLSARGIAKALTIRATTVRHYLTVSLGMKCYHMRWAPLRLKERQESKRVQMAGRMLLELEKRQTSNVHFLFPPHELWMFYQYHHTTMWAVSYEDVDEIVRPERQTMDSSYFAEEVGTDFERVLRSRRNESASKKDLPSF
jgi:hypothetical protein